jgi:hypothetical protein
VSRYRVGWLTVALSLGLVGLGAAVVVFKAAVLIVLPLFAVVGVLVSRLFVTDSADAASWSRYRHLCRVALVWGTAGGAVAGLAALVGPLGLLVAALMVAASPGALRACRRGLGSVPRPTEAQLDALARSLACTNPMFVPFELTIDLRLLTDEQLRHAWHNSGAAVSSPSTPRALLRAVEERGRYLDELERRQPSLLRAWLSSDVGAPDSPLPYVAASSLESLAINWDELTGGQASDR